MYPLSPARVRPTRTLGARPAEGSSYGHRCLAFDASGHRSATGTHSYADVGTFFDAAARAGTRDCWTTLRPSTSPRSGEGAVVMARPARVGQCHAPALRG